MDQINEALVSMRCFFPKQSLKKNVFVHVFKLLTGTVFISMKLYSCCCYTQCSAAEAQCSVFNPP